MGVMEVLNFWVGIEWCWSFGLGVWCCFVAFSNWRSGCVGWVYGWRISVGVYGEELVILGYAESK